MRRALTIQEYIRDRVWPTESDCWEWQGHCNGDGYGISLHRGKSQYAHRASYEAFVGPIPTGLTIDHLCRNRCCVNPEHMEPVTRKVNILRGDTWGGKNSRKTHCKRGHEFTPENTIPCADGGRRCRACNNERNKKWREDNPDEARERSREYLRVYRDKHRERVNERSKLAMRAKRSTPEGREKINAQWREWYHRRKDASA